MSHYNLSAAFKNAAIPAGVTLFTSLITAGAANLPGPASMVFIPMAVTAGTVLTLTFQAFAKGLDEPADSEPEEIEPETPKPVQGDKHTP